MSRISLINPFNNHLFSTYYVSGTVHSTGATLVNALQSRNLHGNRGDTLLTNQLNSRQVARDALRKKRVRGWRLNDRGSFLGRVGQKRPERRRHLSRHMVKGRKQNHVNHMGRVVLAMGTANRRPQCAWQVWGTRRQLL